VRLSEASSQCGYIRAGKLPVVLHEHKVIATSTELTEFEDKRVNAGYEGVICRSIDGRYKHGRSTLREGGMLKLKRFSDSEAIVIGIEELLHNANELEVSELGYADRSSHKDNKVPMGTMGALVARDVTTGIVFNIGTGFDAAERQWFWDEKEALIESCLIVKYKFFSVGVKDKPRHPVYLGLRDKEDL